MTELQRFVWEHREDDPFALALSGKQHPGLPIAYLARQVDALQKIRRKIPSWHQPGLEFPVALSVEQASSEATARYKAGLFSGADMADLSGGLGVDTFFFARQFQQAGYIEQVPDIFAAAKHNLTALGADNVTFHLDDAARFLEGSRKKFDLLYLDPARRDERKGKVFQLADCTPNVLAIKSLLLETAPKILIKTAPLLDISQAVQQLENVSKIWVLEYEGECREVLYLLERAAPAAAQVPIFAISLDATGKALHSFEFSVESEQAARVDYAEPSGFLYEPMPSILKAGAFKSFSRHFGLNKLHPNTHLYCSGNLIPNLPARSFRIDAVCKYDKKAVTSFIAGGKANISTRNFPDNTAQVRNKLALKDGGDVFVFACTNCAGEKVLIVCTKAA
jgi:16S rRNA G966 N2-methylase RsmD